jgi:long-chain fatty acid transport protein
MTAIAKWGLGAGALLTTTALAGNVLAAGFYIQEQSAAGVGRAQSGNVVAADDASTVYFNPAGMTELPGLQAAAGVDLIIPNGGLTNNGSVDRSTGAYLVNPLSGGYSAPGGNNGGNPGSATPVPDLYLTAEIPNSPITLGLALTAPVGFTSQFSPSGFARYDSIESKVVTIDFAPTIAWKVNDWLSVGAGIDEQYVYVKLSQALPNPLTLGGPTAATDGSLTLAGHEWATGWNAGILVKAGPATKLGFSYRSAITHNVVGSVNFSGLTGPLAVQNGTFAAGAALNLPDIYAFGIAQKITPLLTLMAEGDYYGWSVFNKIDVHLIASGGDLVTPENYRDTYAFGVSGEYQLTDQWKLRGGVKYDQTPTVSAFRDTRVPDGDRFWVAGGVHYQFSDQIGVDASYAHIFVTSESINVTRTFYATVPFPIPTTATIDAQSNVSLDILTVGLTYKF